LLTHPAFVPLPRPLGQLMARLVPLESALGQLPLQLRDPPRVVDAHRSPPRQRPSPRWPHDRRSAGLCPARPANSARVRVAFPLPSPRPTGDDSAMRLEHGRAYRRADGAFLVAVRRRTGWGLATLRQYERWQPPRLRVTPDGRVFDREGTPQRW